jgi:uncharacterized protein Smg (DUF494 family)
MKQSLAKIVDVILQCLEDHSEAPPSEHGLRKWLARQGYKKGDIDAALQMVGTRFVAPPIAQRSPGAVRQLSSYEAYKLSSEARNALVRLELYELIEPHERELLLDRLGQFEGEVSMDDLDYLVSWVMCTTRDFESQQTVYGVFEGTRNSLH